MNQINCTMWSYCWKVVTRNDFSHKLNNNYFPSLIIANSEWMKKRTSQYHRFRTHQYLFNTNEYIRILKKEK